MAAALGVGGGAKAVPLPPPPFLNDLLSTCYQASLLREEERPVQIRLVLADPEFFPASEVPPLGLHRQMFAQLRPCDELELRTLSPAVDFSRSLIGVALTKDGHWAIWGIVNLAPAGFRRIAAAGKLSRTFPKCRSSW